MADGSILIDTNLDASGLQKGLSKLGSMTSTAIKGTVTAISAVGAALGAAGIAAIKVGADFEAGMSRVEAISGATAGELDQLTEKAKQLGADTKFSAGDAAQAFEYMAMAGWKTADMLDGIDGVMNLAAASGEDLALVSDIVTDAMTAFGLQASDSAHFADVLAKASASSNTNVGMMGETFKYVAPVAGAMGYSIEDTALAIGLMANMAIKGSMAGTSLKAIFSRLGDATEANISKTRTMAENLDNLGEGMNLVEKVTGTAGKGFSELQATLGFLGITAVNADGSMKPLKDLMVELRTNMAGLTDQEKAFAAETIAGKEAMAGFLAIINANDADFEKLAAEIDNSAGAAERMAAIMQDNLKGAVEELGGSLETLGIEFYESVDNPLKNIAQRATEYVNQITQAFKGAKFDTALESREYILDLKLKGFSPQEIATITQGGMDAMLLVVGNVFSEIITKIAEAAPVLINAATSAIEAFLSGISQNLPQISTAAIGIVLSLVQGITTTSTTFIEAAVPLLQALVVGIQQNAPQIAEGAVSIITALANGIITLLPSILEAGTKLIIELALGLAEALPELIPSAIDAVITIVTALLDNIDLLIDAAIALIMGLADGLIAALPNLIEKAPEIIQKLVDALVNNIPKLLIAAAELIIALAKGLIENYPKIRQAAWEILGHLVSGIIEYSSNILSAATEIISKLWNAIVETDWMSLGSNMIDGIISGIVNAAESLVDAAVDAAESAWNGMKKFLRMNSPSKLMRDTIGVNMIRGISVGVEQESPNLDRIVVDDMQNTVARMKAAVQLESMQFTGAITATATHNAVLASPQIPQQANFAGTLFGKAADTLVIREEADIAKIAKALYQEVTKASRGKGGAGL